MDMSNFDEFLNGYLVCALWSSVSWETEQPLDDDYSIEDISPETMAEMKSDCKDFVKSNIELLAELNPSQCGHDFWLTRNGHGAGFWDRGYGELGEVLSTQSKIYGSVDLYVGDDNLIYC